MRASRRRATRVAAAAPNSRIIGGAGTGVPPVELDEEPPLDEALLELAEDEAELLLALDPVLLEVEVLLPKLLEPPVAPLDVEPLLALLLAEEEALLADEALLPELPELPLEPLLPELPLLPLLPELPLLPWLDEPWLDEPWLELP